MQSEKAQTIRLKIDSGRAGETADVTLIDPTLWKQRWDNYQPATATFEPVGEITITGS